MDPACGSRAVSPLDAVAAAFQSRVAELQDLVLARNMFPATVMPDLASVDASVTALESQVQAIRSRLQEELDAIPRAKKLVERSLKQQEKLQHMLANLPSGMHEDVCDNPLVQNASRMSSECFDLDSTVPQVIERDFKIKEEPVAAPKKGREPAPRLYISAEELDSLSAYMRGRLTIEKVNIAINEVATYADANAHLVSCPKKKLSEDTWEKALELRDIAATKEVKGKHFFLEADIKGPGLKLDNSGKAILTGACCALEDAVVLARRLAGAASAGNADAAVGDAMRAYEAERLPRVFPLTARAGLVGALVQWENAAVCAVRDGVAIPRLVRLGPFLEHTNFECDLLEPMAASP